MSGETEKQVSGWTTDTLREHLERVMDERDRRYGERFDAQEGAVLKAETATEKRFESVNEFRSTLTDQAALFMPRAEAEARIQRLVDDIGELKETRANNLGSKAAQAAMVGLAIAIITVVVVVANFVSART